MTWDTKLLMWGAVMPSVSHLPNLLSLFRIALIPLLMYYLTDPGPSAGVWAFWIFFVASWTDYFDGYIARLQGRTSTLGKLLDPLADKLLMTAALIMLLSLDRFPRVPAWLVVLLIGRELAVTGLRGIAAGAGVIVEAEALGKYKTLCQIFAVHSLILHYTYWHINFHLTGMYFLWLSVVFSLWSGVDYHLKVIRQLSAGRPALHNGQDRQDGQDRGTARTKARTDGRDVTVSH